MGDSGTSYSIEFAKTGRSKCKRCKEKIEKDEMRIGSLAEDSGRGFSMQSWYHPACFNLPRKFSSGAGKMTPMEFCQDILKDESSDMSILPAKLEEVAEMIGATKKKATSSSSSSKRKASGRLGELEAALEERNSGEAPKKKKAKLEIDPMVDSYERHHKKTAEDLKNYLRWNRQVMTGNKAFVLLKVIDGEVNGRLARCSLCGGGKLKMADDGTGNKIICGGNWDEDIGSRIECHVQYTADKAPRWQWFDRAPTQEEEEEMDRLEATMAGEGGAEESPDTDELVEKAKSIEWKLDGPKQTKATVAAIVKLCQDDGRLDLPDDPKRLKMDVGSLVVANKDKTPEEVMKLVISKYGLAKAKNDKAKRKETAIEEVCGHPANAGVVAAFTELAELYFKEGNRNAGLAYNKAASALKGLDFEITAENAKGLGKGKTKVNNIGKSSADKIFEFFDTGTIAKLEEKRADAA